MARAKYGKEVKWHDFLGNEQETLVENESSQECITLKLDSELIFCLDDQLALAVYEELGKALKFACVLKENNG